MVFYFHVAPRGFVRPQIEHSAFEDGFGNIFMTAWSQDCQHMLRALALARQGEGRVEPNPMVGCVIAQGNRVVGEGFHARFGSFHAEVEALRAAGELARGATAYVTLEPCCHVGKTPPCTGALIAAGVARVVAAQRDPFPRVAGQGLAQLAAAGILVEAGCLEAEARQLNAPYLTLLERGRPFVLAKWAMTVDGKIATCAGESRWISSPASRAQTHQLRGRMDAILIGHGTAQRDNPLLTTRPPGVRTATRVVLASRAQLSPTSELVRTARETPLLVVAGPEATAGAREMLQAAGAEVLVLPEASFSLRLKLLLAELGRRQMTNVLVEGGSQVLGALFDLAAVDEVHVFIAPKIVGGASSPTPVAGAGQPNLAAALKLVAPQVERLEDDMYLRGRIDHAAS